MAELLTQRIRRNASELRLPGLAEDPDELVHRVEAAQLGYREFLVLVLESEVGVLEGRRYQSWLKLAGLPHRKISTNSTSPSNPSSTPSARPSCARCDSWSAKSVV